MKKNICPPPLWYQKINKYFINSLPKIKFFENKFLYIVNFLFIAASFTFILISDYQIGEILNNSDLFKISFFLNINL